MKPIKPFLTYTQQIQHLSTNKGLIILLQYQAQQNLCFGDGCDIKQNNCPIGTMIPGDIDTADGQLDDIESRIDELNNEIDMIENRIDGVANMDEELQESSD